MFNFCKKIQLTKMSIPYYNYKMSNIVNFSTSNKLIVNSNIISKNKFYKFSFFTYNEVSRVHFKINDKNLKILNYIYKNIKMRNKLKKLLVISILKAIIFKNLISLKKLFSFFIK